MNAPPNKHRFLPQKDGQVVCGASMDKMWEKFRAKSPTAFEEGAVAAVVDAVVEKHYTGTLLLQIKERLINAHFNCLTETEAIIRNIIC